MTDVAALIEAVLVRPALVVAGAAVLARLLRRGPAAARHAVWVGTVVALVALPLVQRAVPPLVIPGIGTAVTSRLSTVLGVGASGPLVVPQGAADGRKLTSVDRHARSVAPGGRSRMPMAVVVAWMTGVLLMLARRISAEAHARRIVRASRRPSPRLERLFARALDASTRRPPTCRVTDDVSSPTVTGVLRPVVLLPAAAERWSDVDLDAAFAHELGHVARADTATNLLGDLARAVYWCNPLVHAAVRRLRAEAEAACDDQVLARGVEPRVYARLLLAVARGGRGDAPRAAIAMARTAGLESRLQAVLASDSRRVHTSRWAPLAIVAAAALTAVPAAALSLQPTANLAQHPLAPEPDQAMDSLAAPHSERVPNGSPVAAADVRRLRAGPDSSLAAWLVTASAHEPDHEADLVRDRALWALAQARGDRLVDPLLERLDDPDWRVRAYAAWALAPVRDPRAVTPLIAMLEHPVWRLRAMAAHALEASGDRLAAPAMERALADPAWQVRVEAVAYFAALGDPHSIDLIRPRLRDRHVAVRLAAERALTTT